MPKIVDPAERRELIADALFRVIVRDGLSGVSLRHVASEAGVTAGMVQHYFASKDDMMAFAMHSASTRYEERIRSAVGRLGDAPSAGATLRAVLENFIPSSADELRDGRISLEFQAFAARRADLAGELAAGEKQLRDWLASLLAGATGISSADAATRATALLGTAEGLGTRVLSAGLPAMEARSALHDQLQLNGIT